MTVTITPTSRRTSEVSPLTLRESERVRLLFCPMLVDNAQDSEASVNGTLLYQRKGKSGEWEDIQKKNLSSLKSGEEVSLYLHSGEIKKLCDYINHLYTIYETHGTRPQEREFELTPVGVASFFKEIAGDGNPSEILEKLQNLDVGSLEKLNAATGLANLKRAVTSIEENIENINEDFWQSLFQENSWVLAQIFAYLVIVLKGKAYMGGKGLDNQGGSIVDFVLQNKLTKNTILVEIKTPSTQLVSSSEYRSGVYAVSQELAGAITQVLTYKQKYLQEASTLLANEDAHAFDPRGVVIIGNLMNSRLTVEQLRSFELYRRQLKDVEVITFDEILKKTKHLIDLLEKPSNDEEDFPILDVPF